MSKIPLSKDFSITANVISPAGTALDANGLMLTDNPLIPAGTVSIFGSAQEVADLLGTHSREYQAATLYFSGYDNATVLPAALFMSRLALEDASGWLLSGSLAGVSLETMKSLTGKVKLKVDDGQPVTSGAVDFNTATTMSDIATVLQTAIGASVTVEWLPQAGSKIHYPLSNDRFVKFRPGYGNKHPCYRSETDRRGRRHPLTGCISTITYRYDEWHH